VPDRWSDSERAEGGERHDIGNVMDDTRWLIKLVSALTKFVRLLQQLLSKRTK